ncbi:hypothetical protein CPB86DRAFT_821872 [Serendipita vermifera]|nr:hypothetical protein CPB86DRAFT_821872 [Serendipita vermifera]
MYGLLDLLRLTTRVHRDQFDREARDAAEKRGDPSIHEYVIELVKHVHDYIENATKSPKNEKEKWDTVKSKIESVVPHLYPDSNDILAQLENAWRADISAKRTLTNTRIRIEKAAGKGRMIEIELRFAGENSTQYVPREYKIRAETSSLTLAAIILYSRAKEGPINHLDFYTIEEMEDAQRPFTWENKPLPFDPHLYIVMDKPGFTLKPSSEEIEKLFGNIFALKTDHIYLRDLFGTLQRFGKTEPLSFQDMKGNRSVQKSSDQTWEDLCKAINADPRNSNRGGQVSERVWVLEPLDARDALFGQHNALKDESTSRNSIPVEQMTSPSQSGSGILTAKEPAKAASHSSTEDNSAEIEISSSNIEIPVTDKSIHTGSRINPHQSSSTLQPGIPTTNSSSASSHSFRQPTSRPRPNSPPPPETPAQKKKLGFIRRTLNRLGLGSK